MTDLHAVIRDIQIGTAQFLRIIRNVRHLLGKMVEMNRDSLDRLSPDWNRRLADCIHDAHAPYVQPSPEQRERARLLFAALVAEDFDAFVRLVHELPPSRSEDAA